MLCVINCTVELNVMGKPFREHFEVCFFCALNRFRLENGRKTIILWWFFTLYTPHSFCVKTTKTSLVRRSKQKRKTILIVPERAYDSKELHVHKNRLINNRSLFFRALHKNMMVVKTSGIVASSTFPTFKLTLCAQHRPPVFFCSSTRRSVSSSSWHDRFYKHCHWWWPSLCIWCCCAY